MRYEHQPAEHLSETGVRVQLGAAGICGSDQHYFEYAQMGDFKIRDPLVLGHELSGDVIEVGQSVDDFTMGDRVVIDPAKTCGRCTPCKQGRANLCTDVEFMGSASRYPHIAGGFRDEFVVDSSRCILVPRETPHRLLVFAEPLSVALHAVQRAGSVLGKRVLVTGAGTIGALIAAAVKLAGAQEVVATDLNENRRNIVLQMGADSAFDPNKDAEVINKWALNDGVFDVAFEATGTQGGFQDVIRSTVRGGKSVLVGMIPTSECKVPFHILTTREIDLISTFRQNQVFGLAANLLVSGDINPLPILTSIYPLEDCQKAFAASFDRDLNIKVAFSGGAFN